MNTEYYAFGEILWDCLPSGRHAGGAPFNVTAHLAQLGVSAALISSVGQDVLGEELLTVAADKKIETRFITRARSGLPTSTVLASVNSAGNATYEIVQPVAWDELTVSEEALAAVAQGRALVYGSLAARSPHNVQELRRLLSQPRPRKFFDVNLRTPFADPALVLTLGRSADVIKLNDEEVGRMSAWLKSGHFHCDTPSSPEELASACRTLADATETSRICVTRGPQGAALWENGELLTVPAPHVQVKDTVGAGDAFMAGLMVGLGRNLDIRLVLENACRLGAFVTSHNGATPLLPPELITAF